MVHMAQGSQIAFGSATRPIFFTTASRLLLVLFRGEGRLTILHATRRCGNCRRHAHKRGVVSWLSQTRNKIPNENSAETLYARERHRRR